MWITSATAHTKIRVFDNSWGCKDDDWAEVFILQDIDPANPQLISSFEGPFSNDYVEVVVHYMTNLDGKVSRVEAEAPFCRA